MKVLPLLLAASLVGNVALVTPSILRSAGPGPRISPRPPGSSAPSRPGGTPVPPAGAPLVLPPELVEAVNANDPESLRDLLRSAGVSDDIIRALVRMQVWKKYETRLAALQPAPDPGAPWWQENQQNPPNGGMTKARRDELRALQREIRDETDRLVGADASRAQDPRLGFLPAEKRQALQQIQRDYQDLIGEVQQDAQGFRLASDAEKIRFLQEEQKRDIDALMTPDERQAYELRMSPTARQLRRKMARLDASEQEYLALFPLQKAFDEKYSLRNDGYSEPSPRDQTYWKERREAERLLQEQTKAIVGEQRYAQSLRLQDNDYQQLEAAARRLELAPDTPARVYALRDTAASAVQQITDNASLTTDQKKEALAAVAARTRDQVRASLGNEGADAYFKNNGMPWLKELEKGNTIAFRKDAAGWETKALPKEAKKTDAR